MKHSPYLSSALNDLEGTVHNAHCTLGPVDFDAIVCIGVSGMLVGPALAVSMGKGLAIVRKTDDKQNHAVVRVETNMKDGDRWIFVDDLISSGETARRVSEIMLRDGWGDPTGTYLYNSDEYTKGGW